jgi:DNA-binding CsgD family transcriptional regulator
MHGQFILNRKSLESFINNIPQAAYVNLLDTGECINANQEGLAFLNHKLDAKLLSSDCPVPQCGQEITNSSFLLSSGSSAKGQKASDSESIYLDTDGKLVFYNRVKMPVFDCEGKVSAILSINFKSEKVVSPVDLHQLYKSIYKDKKIAVEKTLKHLNIFQYFEVSITEKELICLLHMRINTAHKYLADKLFVSKKTIETHVSRLLQKSRDHSLTDAISCMRSAVP